MMRIWQYLVVGAIVWIAASVLLSIFLPGTTNAGADLKKEVMPVVENRTAELQTKEMILEIGQDDKNIKDKHEHSHSEMVKHEVSMKLHANEDAHYIEIFPSHGCTGTPIKIMADSEEALCDNCWDSCGVSWPEVVEGEPKSVNMNTRSILVMSKYKMKFYKTCKGTWSYEDPAAVTNEVSWTKGSCVSIPPFAHVEFLGVPKKSLSVSEVPSYHVAFSAESSFYFAYQSMANLYAFETSGQRDNAVLTRLLTCSKPDDLMNTISTFQMERDSMSLSYSPFNKPDIIAKWFASDQAPTEEVIVIIDPDNWLVKDLSPIVSQVKEGQAFGSIAFYQSNPRLNMLWQEYCTVNCDIEPDAVAVPYFVHRNDLAQIAPLWREYTRKIREDVERDPKFVEKYRSIQMSWCAEMFAYNFAAAHLGIRHTAKGYLQLRDVDKRRSEKENEKILMIHMGRAWFPKDYEPGYQWSHTEGKSWSYNGNQVWCKCNYTAGTVIPWPLPDEIDFVSRVTLTVLHNALLKYPLPSSSNYYRQPANGHDYHYSHK